MQRLNQSECLRYEGRWKIYWWGGRRDEGVIREIERFPSLVELPNVMDGVEILTGQGYKESNQALDADWLSEYQELPARKFQRYGRITESDLVSVPPRVERRGVREIYEGARLLLSQGVRVIDSIVARLETSPFCFRSSINGVRLDGLAQWQQSVILGIFWSSLAKYYFWLTAGSWGTWHDQLHLHIAERMPIAFPKHTKLRERIVQEVEKLRATTLAHGDARLAKMEDSLDEAIFDLYELDEAERDLVRDMCNVGLDFFQNRSESAAVAPATLPSVSCGLMSDLPRERVDGLTGYLQVFLRHWNADLAPDGELAWEIIPGPGSAPVLAALFFTVPAGERPILVNRDAAWADVLDRIGRASLVPAEARHTIYVDTFVRAVSEHEILIIKRNETRFWTRSAALADADASVAQAMSIAEAMSIVEQKI
ncbi:hypothetical protein [Polyangium jinanense]|uniref:Uncharacterized protein n=1 Tax=Polyangium jinanense TaxID=2829994 RepID=A0A9X3XGG1_9BACT|nr:hypothetical protein [Polyangium jinanense]MDC3989010.1 hypothetical protein [Polyangium jinanense]